MPDIVYQTNKFEVTPLNNPELADVLEGWGIPDALKDLPKDSLELMQADNAFLILNTSTGGLGVIDPVTLATSFEEEVPTKFMTNIRATFIEQVLEKAAELADLEESEDFFRGANAMQQVIADIRANRQGDNFAV